MAQVQPSVVSLGGGLILNKDVFSMSPGEALQLRNFEPDIEGGYKKVLGTTSRPLFSRILPISSILGFLNPLDRTVLI